MNTIHDFHGLFLILIIQIKHSFKKKKIYFESCYIQTSRNIRWDFHPFIIPYSKDVRTTKHSIVGFI
ncbi:hypothetical protein EUGRSUZ_H00468 [Eucalyptus grandis]|uniref:Uncharacterized protein n=2 Tax=Eucalyptus grandis TaxID=71139 RepID=A0ACC3JN26_EUCGR|nr:hypothetical protein EUGRSUZ_H00468 [Eucalyptus grandis]